MLDPEKRDREPLTEEEAEETFCRLRNITAGLLRVPKAEVEQRLAEKRNASRRHTRSDSLDS
jgi:hypothetical protein